MAEGFEWKRVEKAVAVYILQPDGLTILACHLSQSSKIVTWHSVLEEHIRIVYSKVEVFLDLGRKSEGIEPSYPNYRV